jgi:hypothetical protein
MRDPTVCRGCGKNLREGNEHEADCLASKLDSLDQYNERLVDTNRALAAERDEALGKLNAIRKLLGTTVPDEDAVGKGGRATLVGKTTPLKPMDLPGKIVNQRCDNSPCALDAGHAGMCSSVRPQGKQP